MKIRNLILRLGAGVMVFSSVFVSHLCAQSGPISDKYIVLLNPSASPIAVAARHGLAPDFVYQSALHGFAGTIPPGRLRGLRNDPRVVAVVTDQAVFAFARPGGGGSSTVQIVPEGVKRIGAAPAVVGYTGAGIGVAVVDTGVDLAHHDLAAVDAFSAFGGSAQDDNGHGTHVSGIIAALNNGIDVVGVAPGAQIYAVKVLDSFGQWF